MKLCKDCNKKPAGHRNSRGFRSTRCEDCQKLEDEKRKEWLKAYGARWRAAHPNYQREYYRMGK